MLTNNKTEIWIKPTLRDKTDKTFADIVKININHFDVHIDTRTYDSILYRTKY